VACNFGDRHSAALPGGVAMINKFALPQETILMSPCEPHDLVRGQEQCLLERVAPVLAHHNVTLDLHHVERIDAAGIAALISLYRKAIDCGREFTVVHAAPRVAAILALVGLDAILFAHDPISAAAESSLHDALHGPQSDAPGEADDLPRLKRSAA
jgi:anti-anti-sigma factor